MLKKILTIVAMLYAAASFAAVDVNKATAAELDGIKGIGPGISTKILDERKKGNFKDWNDFIERVKGVGETNATKFSAEGMTVNGSGFKGAAATPAPAKKDDKPAAKDDKKADAKMKADEAKAKKEADKKAKADEKAKKAEEATAKKDADKKAATDKKAASEKPAAKDEKKTAEAKPAAAAASAAKK